MSYFDGLDAKRVEGQLCEARDLLEDLDLGAGVTLAEWRTAVAHRFGRTASLMLTARLIKSHRAVGADSTGKRYRVASNGNHGDE